MKTVTTITHLVRSKDELWFIVTNEVPLTPHTIEYSPIDGAYKLTRVESDASGDGFVEGNPMTAEEEGRSRVLTSSAAFTAGARAAGEAFAEAMENYPNQGMDYYVERKRARRKLNQMGWQMPGGRPDNGINPQQEEK